MLPFPPVSLPIRPPSESFKRSDSNCGPEHELGRPTTASNLPASCSEPTITAPPPQAWHVTGAPCHRHQKETPCARCSRVLPPTPPRLQARQRLLKYRAHHAHTRDLCSSAAPKRLPSATPDLKPSAHSSLHLPVPRSRISKHGAGCRSTSPHPNPTLRNTRNPRAWVPQAAGSRARPRTKKTSRRQERRRRSTLWYCSPPAPAGC